MQRDDDTLLTQCLLSGQISAAQWHAHCQAGDVPDDRFAHEGGDASDDDAPPPDASDVAAEIEVVVAAAAKALTKLYALGAVEGWAPSIETPPFGVRPGRQLTQAEVLEHVSADVRSAFTPWLFPEIQKVVEK
jgi:hypothetical protein